MRDNGPVTTTERCLEEGAFAVTMTDPQGLLTFVNEAFARISGFDPEELLGQPHNRVRHPDMPAAVFTRLWWIGAALLTLFGLVALLNVTSSGHTLAAATQARDQHLPAALMADEMAYQTVQIQQFITDAALTGNPQSIRDAEQANADFKRALARYRGATPESQAAAGLDADADQLLQVGKTMTGAYQTQGKAAGDKLMERFDQASDHLADTVRTIRTREVETIQQRLSSIVQGSRTYLWGNGLGGLLGFLLCAALFTLLVLTLGNQLGGDPIQAMALALAHAIAEGDLHVEIRTPLGDRSSLLAALRTMQSRTSAEVAPQVAMGAAEAAASAVASVQLTATVRTTTAISDQLVRTAEELVHLLQGFKI